MSKEGQKTHTHNRKEGAKDWVHLSDPRRDIKSTGLILLGQGEIRLSLQVKIHLLEEVLKKEGEQLPSPEKHTHIHLE